VPYVSEYQKVGLVYAYEAWQDFEGARQKVIRDDVETVIIDAVADRMWSIFPAQSQYLCWIEHVHGGTGPTRRLTMSFPTDATALGAGGDPPAPDPPQNYLSFILPDLSEFRWTFKGTETHKESGEKANLWEWDLTEGEAMEMSYRFWTAVSDDRPLELSMLGVNLYTGGHKDVYVATYYNFEAAPDSGFPEGTFSPPPEQDCTDADPDFAGKQRPHEFLRKMMPNVHWGHQKYDAFAHRHGRRHASLAEYTARRGHFEASAAFVDGWTRKEYSVALNQLADWSREEYQTLLGLRRRPDAAPTAATATLSNFTSAGAHFLPAEVNWRGTPADSPVKDQAACGSCWAFSAIGALETAAFRLTGHQTLLSEQEMMDCGWDPPGSSTGCFGGEQDAALAWALARGGAALQDDYSYQGVNNFCRNDAEKVEIKGRLVVVKGGEAATQAALMTQGPLAVSVDAEDDGFRFYAGGLYSNPNCATKADDLNHAVLLSGYGSDPESGTPYWLVKNMWSPWWGEKGYIRISRQPNDCGIATQPMYVQLDDEDGR
jgi:cathepsin L